MLKPSTSAAIIRNHVKEGLELAAEHRLPNVDFVDVHNYPRDDLDSYVDSPTALHEFMQNRVAAAYSIGKPLVFGEFGMGPEGYQKFSPAEWFRAYFEGAARTGARGKSAQRSATSSVASVSARG